MRSIRRRLFLRVIGGIDRARGSNRANRAFFDNPIASPGWDEVRQRLTDLHRHDPHVVDSFVTTSLEMSDDPNTIVWLSRHPLSIDQVRAWLTELAAHRSDSVARRLQRHRLLGAAVAGAGSTLLPPSEADALVTWISNLYHTPDSAFFQFVDSMGLRPAVGSSSDDGDRQRLGTQRRATRRLVLVEHGDDVDAIATLFHGASAGTLFATTDTFGRIDLGGSVGTPLPIEVEIEHVRTRITRFSQRYIDVHTATASVAERLAAALTENAHLGRDVDAGFLAAELADAAFFKVLATCAIARLTEDDFDHIVVAVDRHNESSPFIRQLGSVEGFWSDPRVEIVSISHSPQQRAKFWRLADGLLEPEPTRAKRMVPAQLTGDKLDENCARAAAGLPELGDGTRVRALLATTASPAYDTSTAEYIRVLADRVDLTVMHVGEPSDAIVEAVAGLGDGVGVDLITVSEHLGSPNAPTDLAAHIIRDTLTTLSHDDEMSRLAASVIEHNLTTIARRCAIPAMTRMKVFEHWFRIAARNDQRPDVVVVTPHRSPKVSVIESAARRYRVPTIVVEPHAHDANYSRYLKVAADYYGVMSEYFRVNAAAGLGVPLERVRAIGSPRQVAPPSYDHASLQIAERRRLALRDPGFDPDAPMAVFFAQPSDWEHVAQVWRNVLTAAHEADFTVALKPHPEEVSGRIRRYLDIADEFATRVIVLDGDAEQAVAAADIVLTAYSAAAIDAAIRAVPVISVTDGDVDYPVDIAQIVHAPFLRSADELRVELSAFRHDPESFRRRARTLLDLEPQFVTGPGPGLIDLIDEAVELGPDAIRRESDVPVSLFIDGPHPTYRV